MQEVFEYQAMRLAVGCVENGEVDRGLVGSETEPATLELTPLDDDQSIEERILSRAIAVGGVVLEHAAEHRALAAGQGEQFRHFCSILEVVNLKLGDFSEPEEVERKQTTAKQKKRFDVAKAIRELILADLPEPAKDGLISMSTDSLKMIFGGQDEGGVRIPLINEAVKTWFGDVLVDDTTRQLKEISSIKTTVLDVFIKRTSERQKLVTSRRVGHESFDDFVKETDKINDYFRLKAEQFPHPAKMKLSSVLCILSTIESLNLPEQDGAAPKKQQIVDIYTQYLADWGIIKQPSRGGVEALTVRGSVEVPAGTTFKNRLPDSIYKEGKCIKMDTKDAGVFFSDSKADIRAAKKVCQGCVVIDACLEYALENRENHGVLGGLSAVERRSLRSRGMS